MTWFFNCIPNWLLSRQNNQISSLCTLITSFKRIWLNLIIVCPVDSFQDYMNWFYIVYPIHSFQDHLISFCILYQIHSFQDHMTWFLYCIPNWLLSTPNNLISPLCTLITSFKRIWLNLIIVCPIDSLQDYMTWFLHCVPNLPNWLLSRPFDIIFVFCTKFTPFKSIWPDFCIAYLIDSFQDQITQFLPLCTLITPFKRIWPNLIIMYPIDTFQDHITWFLHCVLNVSN